jgi:hypothetical protein
VACRNAKNVTFQGGFLASRYWQTNRMTFTSETNRLPGPHMRICIARAVMLRISASSPRQKNYLICAISSASVRSFGIWCAVSCASNRKFLLELAHRGAPSVRGPRI